MRREWRGEGNSTARACGRMGAAVLALAAAGGLAFGLQDDAVGENTIRVHRDADFQGKEQVVHPVTSERAARLHVLEKKLRDKTSSIEWNLPRGVLVIFYDHTNGTGRQFPIWGSGRRGSLEEVDFENRAAAWAWAYVDGWDDAPRHVRSGFAVRPLMTKESKERAAENSLELHRDTGARDKRDHVLKISPVTDRPQGVPQPVGGGLDNKVSSLRWNLPPGVVVILYDNADGTGRRQPFWGHGEMDDIRAMNNRTSAWAWYDLSAERTE